MSFDFYDFYVDIKQYLPVIEHYIEYIYILNAKYMCAYIFRIYINISFTLFKCDIITEARQTQTLVCHFLTVCRSELNTIQIHKSQ